MSGGADKPVHAALYLLLALGLIRAARASAWSRRTTIAWGLIVPIGYGAFLEAVQSLLPYRSAEWADVVANALGTALGVMLGMWYSTRSRMHP